MKTQEHEIAENARLTKTGTVWESTDRGEYPTNGLKQPETQQRSIAKFLRLLKVDCKANHKLTHMIPGDVLLFRRMSIVFVIKENRLDYQHPE